MQEHDKTGIKSNSTGSGKDDESMEKGARQKLGDFAFKREIADVNKSECNEFSDGFWRRTGNIDYSKKDVGEQLKDVGIALVGTAMGFVNPVLGLAWSVFTSLFGKDQETMSETETLLQDIYARVEKMIDSSLNAFILTLVSDHLSGITDLMTSDLDSDWKNIHSQMMPITRQVFKAECWDNFDKNRGAEDLGTHIEPSTD